MQTNYAIGENTSLEGFKEGFYEGVLVVRFGVFDEVLSGGMCVLLHGWQCAQMGEKVHLGALMHCG